ncbi:MAG: NAD(P)/FAD-dependent oxidoreductase [Desulfobacter sp.]
MKTHYDIIILGGGIAGMTAAIYAARANLAAVILEKSICGGLVNTTYCLENFPSQPGIGGMELMEKVRDQVADMGVDVREVTEVDRLELNSPVKRAETDEGVLTAPVVILATGRRPRELPLETECDNIHYCAICDGSGYRGKQVLVVGGGNSGIEESAYLLSLGVDRITVIEQADRPAASEKAQEELLRYGDRVEILTATELASLEQDNGRLAGVTLCNTRTGQTTGLPMDGIFVYMGHQTQTELFSNVVPLDARGYIKAGPDMGTGIAGVFAAGDIVQKKYYQITTAMNDGTIAALSAAEYLRQQAPKG